MSNEINITLKVQLVLSGGELQVASAEVISDEDEDDAGLLVTAQDAPDDPDPELEPEPEPEPAPRAAREPFRPVPRLPVRPALTRRPQPEPEPEPEEEEQPSLIPDRVADMVDENAPRSEVALYRSYLERCVEELGAQLAPPSTGDRVYVNVLPPGRVRGGRLAALNPRTGRVHCNLSPDMVDDWPHAEVVYQNGEPTYLRIYLRSDDDVEQAVDMARTSLDLRL